MEPYQRRPSDATRGDVETAARETLDQAGGFLRRLIPLSSADEVVSPLSLLPMSGQGGGAGSNAVASVADAVGEQAASIVSQAASVLDEEMARGVLTARRSTGTAPYGLSATSNPILRQVHELVDNVAAVWPSLQSAPAPSLSPYQPPAPDAEPVAELKSRATVKPGQRATISMTLCNSENRTVQLVPTATDLLGSRGGRIACSLLEFAPPECRLEPQEQRDLTIATMVPADTAPGCYSGLLVVRGTDYLRALITIEVE